MPELEREELSLLYQTKGIPADQAQALATEVMRDPTRALTEKVREELKIGDDEHADARGVDHRHCDGFRRVDSRWHRFSSRPDG